MFDHMMRPLVERVLAAAARGCVAVGVSADQITVAAAVAGVAAAVAVTQESLWLALALIAVNRALDGIDGIVARLGRPTDLGGFLDITLDFVVYASVPLAFAVLDPARNALPAAALLAAFLVNGTAFLAFAVMAERHGLTTQAQGRKSLYFIAGLAEGAETVVAFVLMCLLPAYFPQIATAFAALCALSGVARIVGAAGRLARIEPSRPDEGA